MKVVAIDKMFAKNHVEEIKQGNSFYGKDKCVTVNGNLYMPLDALIELGYIYSSKWIEDIDYDLY